MVPCETPPRRPRKPCGAASSAPARMTSTGSAKAARDLLGSVAAQPGRGGDALELGAHQRRADRLGPPPAAERGDEPRRRLWVERVEREDQVGDQAIALTARGVEPVWGPGEGHVER